MSVFVQYNRCEAEPYAIVLGMLSRPSGATIASIRYLGEDGPPRGYGGALLRS